jgi:hypothetical protein
MRPPQSSGEKMYALHHLRQLNKTPRRALQLFPSIIFLCESGGGCDPEALSFLFSAFLLL